MLRDFWYDWDLNAAEKHIKRALELNPNSADTRSTYAGFLSNTGRHAQALPEIRRAIELDPTNLGYKAPEGLFLIHAGKIDEALVQLGKTFELSPNFWLAHNIASSAYIEKEMYAEAINEVRRARKLSPV